jgi:hypothetical protein
MRSQPSDVNAQLDWLTSHPCSAAGAIAAYKSVPEELKLVPNWIVWKRETRKNATTKVPYDAKNPRRMAKSNDSSTWATFEKASAVANDPLSSFHGIGFMLQGTNLVGVDFDGVIDESGSVDPYVLSIIAQLGNPYAEVTPSGTGVRAFVECDALPKQGRKFSNGDHYGVEIYIGTEGGRYLTITGDKLPSSGDGIPTLTPEQIEIPYFLIKQFRNTKHFGNDQSRADLALCDELVKLLGKDRDKVLRYVRASKLNDEKWDRPDYIERTIGKALGVKRAEANTLTAPSKPVIVDCPDIAMKRIGWFWKDRIPFGKITLFCGDPDRGKTLVSTWLAAVGTNGQNFPDDAINTTLPFHVLMLAGEDELDDTVKPRLVVAGADITKVHFLTEVEQAGNVRGFRLDYDVPVIENILREHPEIRMIIIDPVSNYLGDVPMVAEQDVREVLKPLKEAAAKFKIAVVIIMHLNKKSDQDAIARVGGAMAFVGLARASWVFLRDDPPEEKEGDPKTPHTYSMLRLKNNLAQAEQTGLSYVIKAEKIPELNPFSEDECWTPYIVWNGLAKIDDANAAMGNRRAKNSEVRANSKDAKVMAAAKWLEGQLGGGTSKRGTVLIADAKAAAGIAEDHLRKAANDFLHVDIAKKGKVWWWTLPTLNATGEALAGAAQSDLIKAT